MMRFCCSVSEEDAKRDAPKRAKKLFCSYCNKAFRDAFDVRQHERIHTGEKPYSCEICGKSFRRKRDEREHYKLGRCLKIALKPTGKCLLTCCAASCSKLTTLFLAHLSRRLRGELIVYRSSRRPSVSLCVRASVHTFKHEYLCNQLADWNEILSEGSLGWGKGFSRF